MAFREREAFEAVLWYSLARRQRQHVARELKAIADAATATERARRTAIASHGLHLLHELLDAACSAAIRAGGR